MDAFGLHSYQCSLLVDWIKLQRALWLHFVWKMGGEWGRFPILFDFASKIGFMLKALIENCITHIANAAEQCKILRKCNCRLHLWTLLFLAGRWCMDWVLGGRRLSYESLHCFRVSAAWINGTAEKVQWLNWKLHPGCTVVWLLVSWCN